MYAGLLAVVMSLSAQGEGAATSGKVSNVKLAGSLFVMELEARNLGDDTAIAKTLADLIVTELDAKMDRKLISSSEVKELVDVETQRALNDCDQEGCLAEIAGALDADFILLGSVTKVGERGVLQLSLADKKGVIVKRESLNTREGLAELIDRYPEALAPFIAYLEGGAPPVEKPAEQPAPEPKGESGGSPILGLTVFGIGTVVGVVSGLVLWGSAVTVSNPEADLAQRRQLQLALWGSTVGAGVGVLGMGVGGALVLAE